MLNPWAELGIEQTADRSTLRQAYAARLKQVRPEVDPEGFQRLRIAYEEALRLGQGVAEQPSSNGESAAPPVPQTAADPEVEVSPAPPIFQTAVEVLERLLKASTHEHAKLLAAELSQEGRETLDFQASLQRAFSRLLLHHFERFHQLVPLFIERCDWTHGNDVLEEGSVVSELLARSKAREWRTSIETDTARKGLGAALTLLCGPVNIKAFTQFAKRKKNLADMHAVLKLLFEDHPAALRYETDTASVDWWRHHLQAQAVVAQPKRGGGGLGTFGWLFLAVMLIGQLGRCVDEHSRSSSTGANSPPASNATARNAGSASPPTPDSEFDLAAGRGTFSGSRRSGVWSEALIYQPGDVVMHQGRFWRASAALVGEKPTRGSQWQPLH